MVRNFGVTDETHHTLLGRGGNTKISFARYLLTVGECVLHCAENTKKGIKSSLLL